MPWGYYQGLLKQALTLLKYGDQEALGFWFGYQLGQHWQNQQRLPHRSKPLVVPIPLHSERLKQRGYNQAALIAQGFCRATDLPLAEHGLRRTKATVAMHSLGVQARRANINDAFQLNQSLPAKHRPILLLDDIYTTGSTARAASVPLLQGGYTIAGVATVARAISPSATSNEPYRPRQTQSLNLNP